MQRKDQKIKLVSGKGGVGKTAFAVALAQLEARKNKRVLLLELGETSFFKSIFPEAGGDEAIQVLPQLWVQRIDPISCLQEYILHFLKVEKWVQLLMGHSAMRTFIRVAPALKELALFGKITSGPRGVGPDMPYDVVVVDAYATGHFKALLMAPVGILAAIPVGPMGEQSRSMVEVLKDKNTTECFIVTLPEELPVNESIELADFLKNEFSIQPQIILNKVVPGELASDEISTVCEYKKFIHNQVIKYKDAKKRIPFNLLVAELPWVRVSDWSQLASELSQKLELKCFPS